MTDMIAKAFNTLDLVITPKIRSDFEHLVVSFEIRRTHPLALNTQGIGIHPIAFTDEDQNAFFTVVGVDIKTVKALIQKTPAINDDYKVISQPLNIMSMWLLHLAYRDVSDLVERDAFMMNVAKLLHYRFFTSLVNHYFSHGASEKIMAATINTLSRKFDIIVYGTWKKVIEVRCRDLISTNSIHHDAIVKADNDKSFLYALTDTQGRIREKIKTLTKEYYDTRQRGDAIGSRGSTTTDADGEKILVRSAKTLDMMIFNLQTEIMTARLFIDNATVKSIATQFTNVSEDILRSALLAMVALANTQSEAKELDIVKKNDNIDLYVGMRVLIANLIQKSYRYCLRNRVDITSQPEVFLKIKNVYSSSRIGDENILAIKQSVAYLVDEISTSRRDTTKSSLRLAVLLYLIVRSFRFL